MPIYGILGSGTTSKKVITAALDDLGVEVEYIVPWYGKATEGLEHVYDWMLDNNAVFTMIATDKVPKILMNCAKDIFLNVDDVDEKIIDLLKFKKNAAHATILWEEGNDKRSTKLAESCIDAGIPTLELTNGLVPIVFDEEPVTTPEPVAVQQDEPVEEFDRETMENMPAAVVKRMAKDKGHTVKTKDEALEALFNSIPEPVSEQPAKRRIVKVIVHYDDGMVMEL